MRYLAFDIGASSGRAIIGDLRDGKLTLSEVHRFNNEGVRVKDNLYWDILGLWREIKSGMRAASQSGDIAGIGIDTWGVDYALLDGRGELLSNPYCYRDARTDGVMDRVCAAIGREKVFEITGIQFMPINTLYQLAVEREHNPDKVDRARRCLMLPDLLHYWMTGAPGQRVHHRQHHPGPRRPTTRLVERVASTRSASRPRCSATWSCPAPCWAACCPASPRKAISAGRAWCWPARTTRLRPWQPCPSRPTPACAPTSHPAPGRWSAWKSTSR